MSFKHYLSFTLNQKKKRNKRKGKVCCNLAVSGWTGRCRAVMGGSELETAKPASEDVLICSRLVLSTQRDKIHCREPGRFGKALVQPGSNSHYPAIRVLRCLSEPLTKSQTPLWLVGGKDGVGSFHWPSQKHLGHPYTCKKTQKEVSTCISPASKEELPPGSHTRYKCVHRVGERMWHRIIEADKRPLNHLVHPSTQHHAKHVIGALLSGLQAHWFRHQEDTDVPGYGNCTVNLIQAMSVS